MASETRTPLLTPEELETARLRLWTMTYDQPPSRAAVERMHEHALALSAALAEAQRQLENNYDVLAEREVARLEQENARLRAARDEDLQRVSAFLCEHERLRAAGEALAADYEALLGDGVTDSNEPPQLKRWKAALRGERGTE